MRPLATLALAAFVLPLLREPRVPFADAPDVLRYDLDVVLREQDLAVTATIRAAGPVPPKWTLDLAPEMKVVSAEAGGKAVPFTSSRGAVALDLSAGAGAEGGAFSVTLRVEGSPLEENRRMGFVRSAVRPGLVYIRSQHPWYPRVPDDPALLRTSVDAPAGFQVRTAGEFAPPKAAGGRCLWTFETRAPVDRAGLAAGTWKSMERKEDGVCFDALFVAGHETGAAATLDAARRSFAFYGKTFGPLSWNRLTLVELPREFGAGSGYGEEGYILFGADAFEGSGASFAWASHEVAHGWWAHGVRFSDFAAEALAEFSSYLAVREAQGEDAARGMRRAAVLRVGQAAASGKTAALVDVQGFGAGMDSETYRVHAYEKPMMILAMMEKAAGRDAMRTLLARFFQDHRGGRVGWPEVRDALVGSGDEARQILEQWERPGLPTLVIESAAKKTGGSWAVEGRLTQEGTEKPFPLEVLLTADCKGRTISTVVKMSGASAPFSLRMPSEPGLVTVDPEWLLLAARRAAGSADPAKYFNEGILVANDPGEADPAKLEEAIRKLRGALEAGYQQGTCHVGIGRCLFREGKLDEAREELETALRIGDAGPFHRSWAHLRLGCIADLKKKREEAESHYKAVLALPDSPGLKFQRGKAQTFLDRPYRGYKTDG